MSSVSFNPIDLHVDTDSLKEFIGEKRNRLVEVIGNRIDVMNSIVADRIRANLSGQVLKAQSGNLLSTVDWTPSSQSGDIVSGEVHAGGDLAPYGIYFEKGGIGPYIIEAKDGGSLYFMFEGKRIFAKIVLHPAIPHLPWFQPAVDVSTHEIMDDLNEAFGDVLGEG